MRTGSKGRLRKACNRSAGGMVAHLSHTFGCKGRSRGRYAKARLPQGAGESGHCRRQGNSIAQVLLVLLPIKKDRIEHCPRATSFVSSAGAFSPHAERRWSIEKRKQLRQLRLVRPPAIFADFKRLGKLDLVGFVLAVPV